MFLIDCGQNMDPEHIKLAHDAVSGMIQQRIMQGGASNEVGIVCFGLPDEDTSNTMNEQFPEEYLGIREVHLLQPANLDALKHLDEVPELPRGETSDILDALVIGSKIIWDRTQKLTWRRSVYLITNAAQRVRTTIL